MTWLICLPAVRVHQHKNAIVCEYLYTLCVRTSVVPGKLGCISHLTQHSAFGCVLGHHVPAPEGWFFGGLFHRRNSNQVLTHTL